MATKKVRGTGEIDEAAYSASWLTSTKWAVQKTVYNALEALRSSSMLKTTYDTDNDGVVNAAAAVPWLGVVGKPVRDIAEFSDSLSTAATALGSTTEVDLLIKTEVSVPSSLDFSTYKNINFVFGATGAVNVASGQTLYIGRMQDPGNRKVFKGAGNVILAKGAVETMNAAHWMGTGTVSATDFHKGISQIISSCAVWAGSDVFFPQGTYQMNDEVILPSYSRFFCRGYNSTKFQFVAGVNNKAMFKIIEGHRGFFFDNFLFDGGASNSNNVGIKIGDIGGFVLNIIGVKISNCGFDNLKRGWEINPLTAGLEVQQVKTEQNTFLNCTTSAYRINSSNCNVVAFQDWTLLPAGATYAELENVGTYQSQSPAPLGGQGSPACDISGNPDTTRPYCVYWFKGNRGTTILFGGGDEGFQHYLINDSPTNAPIVMIGCTVLSRILINYNLNIADIGNIFPAGCFRCAPGTSPFISSPAYTDFVLNEGNYWTDCPGVFSSNPQLDTQTDGLSYVRFLVSRLYGVIVRERFKVFAGAEQAGTESTSLAKFLSYVTGKPIIEIGQGDIDGAATNTYKATRNASTGYLDWTATQSAPYAGWTHAYPVKAQRQVETAVNLYSTTDVTISEGNDRTRLTVENSLERNVLFPLGLPPNLKMELYQKGTGSIRWAGASGVTVINKLGHHKTNGQHSLAVVRALAQDVFLVTAAQAGDTVGPILIRKVDCGRLGSGTVGGVEQDGHYTGGDAYDLGAGATTNGHDISAAEAGTIRYSNGGTFYYLLPGAVANSQVLLQVLMMANTGESAGSHLMNVELQGDLWLSNYDIFSEAGGVAFSVVKEEIETTADSSGNVEVLFESVSAQAKVSKLILWQL